jgi:uncharacterized protein with gpF-like domain
MKKTGSIGFNQGFIDLINRYFESGILKDCKGITDTTRNLIIAVLKTATEEGRSLDWIVNKLTIESDLTLDRARLIARTETLTATNQAAYFAAAKTGLLMKKEWLSANDSRVRSDHQNVNGSRIDMEDYFTVGNSKMLLPGARTQQNGLPTPAGEVVNCRCQCLFIPQRINGRLVEHDYGL